MELSCETPAPGLRVWQPRRGYRFGVEVYALAAFALGESAGPTWLADLPRPPGGGTPPSPARIVDLGCGSGIVGLLLAWRGAQVLGVERQTDWVALARRSAAEAGVSMTIVEADVRTFVGDADLVVCNPPWFPADQPVSPDPLKAASRSMLHGDVRAFVTTGLRVAPRVCVVTRKEREADLVGLHVARRAMMGGELVLLELRREPCERVDEPLDLPACYAAFGR